MRSPCRIRRGVLSREERIQSAVKKRNSLLRRRSGQRLKNGLLGAKVRQHGTRHGKLACLRLHLDLSRSDRLTELTIFPNYESPQ
jgi:hypothetical protein